MRKFARIRCLRVLAIHRALAVIQLGQLAPEYSRGFLGEALHDPSPLVRRMAVIAMGRNRSGGSVKVLLDELVAIVEARSQMAVRPVKTALVRHSINDFRDVDVYLNHPNARVRFLLVDSIREICRRTAMPLSKSDFHQELYDWFLQRAPKDGSADVRARSAEVIRQFHDDASKDALCKLLRDDNEFVRLHAVRACADPYYRELSGELSERVTDVRWRVREAATFALAGWGPEGQEKLTSLLSSTSDRYAREQIADQLQRSGALPGVISGLLASGAADTTIVGLCTNMAQLGKSSLLADMLLTESTVRLRTLLMDALIAAPTPQVIATLKRVAANANDTLSSKAAALLQTNVGSATAAATGQD